MKKATKNDFDKDKNSLKTFYLHENKRNVADSLKNLILNYKHFENMLIILCYETQNNKQFHILNSLLNKVIMKAISQKLNGGEKTEKNIQELYDHFENHKLFQQMIDFSKENLNGHNCSMIVERLKKDWKNSAENRKKYFKNPKGFTGIPQFPKPKKLEKVQNYSVPLEPGKWAIPNEKLIGITLSKKQIRRKINSDVPYLKDKKIEKGERYGIRIEEIDERYTSKTSSISGDVNEILRIKSLNKEHKFSTTDLKGSRVARGLFKDFGIKKVINADLNGALNHIKVVFKRLKILDFSENLSKFCNPIKVKSESDFENFSLKFFSNRSRSEKYALC